MKRFIPNHEYYIATDELPVFKEFMDTLREPTYSIEAIYTDCIVKNFKPIDHERVILEDIFEKLSVFLGYKKKPQKPKFEKLNINGYIVKYW